MKRNPLFLHEAIVVALINLDKKSFTASFDDIPDFIGKAHCLNTVL